MANDNKLSSDKYVDRAPLPDKKFDTNVYNMVVDINSLDNVNQSGWKIEVSDKLKPQVAAWFEERLKHSHKKDGEYFELSDQDTVDLCKIILPTPQNTNGFSYAFVSALGFFDRGKSWIFSHLTKQGLPSGHSVTTKGISICIPEEESCFVLIDTAGSNSPIGDELLQVVRSKLNLVNDVDLRADTLEERKKLEAQWQEKEDMNRKLIQERAIVDKKSVENYIMSLATGTSDVVLFVVNELTWLEQQAIEALTHQYESVVVIHNFKTTSDIKTFRELREKYVTSIYPGAMRSIPIQNTNHNVEFWQNSQGSLTHFFVARDGSEAGQLINGPTFQQILTLLHIKVRPGRLHPSLALLRAACEKMNGPFFKGPIDDVFMRYHPETKALSICARSRSVQDPFKIIRSQVEYDGLNLGITSSDFTPPMDVIEMSDSLIIKMDLPDLMGSAASGTMEEDYRAHNYVKFNIQQDPTRNQFKLIISGERDTFFRTYTGDSVSTMKTTNDCFRYNRNASSQKLLLAERKGGKFTRYFTLPIKYSADKRTYVVSISDGTLQFRIPKIHIDAEDEDMIIG
eukprot:TRINITY_DN11218_c0_g1_i1.p1 TRINITY_DN11218_c0_g1~~TRINITY_DN11218_c0_g1_i1.p1  ORF type:complete len:597 (+),score=124.90 TRINITY_DN11218_c0_g1_i1:84-1793(+)